MTSLISAAKSSWYQSVASSFLPVVSPPQYAVTLSKEHMGEEKLAEVVEFHRRENLRLAKEEAKAEAADEGDVMKQALAMWETPFMPNLLNTCVFLVETAQQVAVLLVALVVLSALMVLLLLRRLMLVMA